MERETRNENRETRHGKKGMRNDYKDKVYEQKGLVNYLTKQSNRTIDNIDIRNSRY